MDVNHEESASQTKPVLYYAHSHKLQYVVVRSWLEAFIDDNLEIRGSCLSKCKNNCIQIEIIEYC
jgi:hypothetical protein